MRALISVLFFTFVGFSAAAETEISVELVPRIEMLASGSPSTVTAVGQREASSNLMQMIYGRAAIDVVTQVEKTSIRARTEAFASHDYAEESKMPLGAPDIRKSRNEADLSELWLDVTYDSWGIRLGRQPIRWSQSWTVPSLDVLTGRRFNRLFFDPLIDQLTYPDAVRITKSGAIGGQLYEIEGVRVVRQAPTNFPEPLVNRDRFDNRESAVRVSTKFGLFDLSLLGTNRLQTISGKEENVAGFVASYAFEQVVVKLEVGNSDRDAAFGTLGTDWFLGQWMIGPQVTTFRDPITSSQNGEVLFYVPVRYNENQWSLEFDLLLSGGSTTASKDVFSSLRVGRELKDGLVLSFSAQNYRGGSGRLMGLFESMTGGQVFGLRLEYAGGFSK